MSAISDWTVYCNHDGCMAQGRSDDLPPRDGTAADVRRALKRRGWAVSVPDPNWVRAHQMGSRARGRRLDFCPRHKPGDKS